MLFIIRRRGHSERLIITSGQRQARNLCNQVQNKNARTLFQNGKKKKYFLSWPFAAFCTCYLILAHPQAQGYLCQVPTLTSMPGPTLWISGCSEHALTLSRTHLCREMRLVLDRARKQAGENRLSHWTKLKDEIMNNSKPTVRKHQTRSMAFPLWQWSHLMRPTLLMIFISKYVIPNNVHFLLS